MLLDFYRVSMLVLLIECEGNYDMKFLIFWGKVSPLVVGDFNCTDSPPEKRGDWAFVESLEARDFQNFIEKNGLMDLGFVGPQFIWCNNHLGRARVWEMIDRVFVGANWIQLHPRIRFSICRGLHLIIGCF